MTKKNHNTLHSLVPVYASVKRVWDMSIDGIRTGHSGNYLHIRDEAELALSELMKLEQDLANDKHRRRKYELER